MFREVCSVVGALFICNEPTDPNRNWELLICEDQERPPGIGLPLEHPWVTTLKKTTAPRAAVLTPARAFYSIE